MGIYPNGDIGVLKNNFKNYLWFITQVVHNDTTFL